MSHRLLPTLATLALAGCATTPAPSVCFSPDVRCADVVVHELGTARHAIHVLAYGFSHPGIARALADARQRGLDVEVILDKSNQREHYSEADFVARAGVITYIDARHPIAHNKVIVIDEREVITGSFNFTRAADEKNAENLLVIHSASLASRYLENWREHQAHSSRYEGSPANP